MPQYLTRQTLKDQAKKAIREFITKSRFSPGRRINVGYLSKELGVSRTPICQALAELEEEGLVTHSPNQGYFMSEMTTDMALDLYMVREYLEALAVKIVAQKISPEAIDQMRQKAEGQRGFVESGDLFAYSESTFEFHAMVYEACENWALTEVLTLLTERTRPIRIDITPILHDLHQDHLDLVIALEQRDADKAAAISARHTMRMRELIISSARSDEKKVSPRGFTCHENI